MNISGILNSAYLNTGNYNRQSQKVDTVSSATKSNGGDHYFEARA